MTESTYIYKGKHICIYRVPNADFVSVDLYPHSMSIWIPPEHLQEFLDEMAQVAIYCKLNLKKESNGKPD